MITEDAIELTIEEQGTGPVVLLLHGGAGPASCRPLCDALSGFAQVLLPTHPGFAGTPRPRWCDSVDDLAYRYLDLLAERDLRDVVVIGASLGGWIAAEMAVRDDRRIGRLILIDAVGIRVGGREDRDIADLFATSPDDQAHLLYHDPAYVPPAAEAMTAEQAEEIAFNQEALVVYGWEPYLCNPKLHRRLGRVTVPTLVLWGESDRLVTTAYGRAYADAIPGARFSTVADAGHSPHLEQTGPVAAEITAFAHLAVSHQEVQ